MQAAGLGWIATIATTGVGYPALVVPLVLAGIGVSMAMPAAQNAVLGSVAVPKWARPPASSIWAAFLGGMFGIALLVTVFSANGATDTPAHFSTGFAAAIWWRRCFRWRELALACGCLPAGLLLLRQCPMPTTTDFRYRSISQRGAANAAWLERQMTTY